MAERGKTRRLAFGWGKLLLGIGGTGVAVVGVCLARDPVAPKTPAVPAAKTAAVEATAKPSAGSDYSSGFVATFAESRQGITREELGEYLIARHGEKVELLINQRIIEDACKARGIEVTGAEIEHKLAEDLKDLNIDRVRFVKDFLKARQKTLVEWKEDILRPQLQMMKYLRDRLKVSDEEVHNAYESRYGEKVECRIIEWPKGKEGEAQIAYVHIADDEEAFAEAARKQPNTALAAGGGKVKPFGRHTLEYEELEKWAFSLRPGQVSRVIAAPTGGCVIIKCDQRLPANTTVPFEKVSAELAKEVLERKAQKEMPQLFTELSAQAKPERQLERKPSEDQPYGYVRNAPPGEGKNRVVAYLHDKQTVLTRADLGEFLIKRYGAVSLDLLINKRIIENACQALKIDVTDAEVEAEFLIDGSKRGLKDRKEFIAQVLVPNKTSVFQYKEDIIRPRLQLTRLCRDRVKVEAKDLQAAFDAYHGAKVECRMILWPNGTDDKFVLQEWARIRDRDKAFDDLAHAQASPTLAQSGGQLDHPIGHHTTGNDELEHEAFSLKPGEISKVIGTPEGLVVLKCVQHIPADTNANLESCRDQLVKEIIDKKIEATMPLVFKELRDQAQPKVLIYDPNRVEDIKGPVEKALGDKPRSPANP